MLVAFSVMSKYFLLILIALPMLVYSQVKSQYVPFTLGSKNDITAFIEDKPLYPRYKNLFEKYGYSGNGYSWEGIIIQILEKLNPGLLTHIQMDPEAGAFFAHADTKASQLEFVKLLSPIFSDEKKLTVWLKNADHKRISD